MFVFIPRSKPADDAAPDVTERRALGRRDFIVHRALNHFFKGAGPARPQLPAVVDAIDQRWRVEAVMVAGVVGEAGVGIVAARARLAGAIGQPFLVIEKPTA